MLFRPAHHPEADPPADGGGQFCAPGCTRDRRWFGACGFRARASPALRGREGIRALCRRRMGAQGRRYRRSEEHTSELQTLMRNSYAVFCLKKKITKYTQHVLKHND